MKIFIVRLIDGKKENDKWEKIYNQNKDFPDDGKNDQIGRRLILNLDSPPSFFQQFYLAMKIMFFHHNVQDLSALMTEAGCPKQGVHMDFGEDGSNNILDGDFIPYAAITALEDNTEIYLGDENEELKIPIPKFSTLIFRGDQWHSGAEYNGFNNLRLHNALATKKHPHNWISQTYKHKVDAASIIRVNDQNQQVSEDLQNENLIQDSDEDYDN